MDPMGDTVVLSVQLFLIHHYTDKTSYSLSFSEQSDAPKRHVCGKLPANLTYVYSIFGKRQKLKKFHMKDNKNKYEVASRELTYPPPKKGHFLSRWFSELPQLITGPTPDPMGPAPSWHPLRNDMIHGEYHGISVQGDQWYIIYISYGCFLKWRYPQNTPKWSFLVGKPMVVGYHHFRKPPYIYINIYIYISYYVHIWYMNQICLWRHFCRHVHTSVPGKEMIEIVSLKAT